MGTSIGDCWHRGAMATDGAESKREKQHKQSGVAAVWLPLVSSWAAGSSWLPCEIHVCSQRRVEGRKGRQEAMETEVQMQAPLEDAAGLTLTPSFSSFWV